MQTLVYLVGFMASGKTKIGKKIAKKIGYQFIDLDQKISEKINMSIADFFKSNTETDFRLIEQQCLIDTQNLQKTIVATGGGTPCFGDNMHIINTFGASIFIDVETKILVGRLKNETQNKKRPLLNNETDPQKLQTLVENMLSQRRPFYEKSHFSIQNTKHTADDIIKLLT